MHASSHGFGIILMGHETGHNTMDMRVTQEGTVSWIPRLVSIAQVLVTIIEDDVSGRWIGKPVVMAYI
jgi:hypothetical protein